MGGIKLIWRLRARLKRKSFPPLDVPKAEWGFAVDRVRNLVLSYQDGEAAGLWFPEDGTLAAELGHLGLMKALKGDFRYSLAAMDRAAKGGFLKTVRFLARHGHDCTTEAMDGAAKEGYLDVVIWLHENTAAGATKAAMDSASAGGHLHVVKWLHCHRYEGATVSAMNWAAGEGHLGVVKWLHFNRNEGCTTGAFDRAAMNNRMDVIMWLVNNRGEGGTEKALQWAVSRGHTQMVGLLSLPKRYNNKLLSTRASTMNIDSSSSFETVNLDLGSPDVTCHRRASTNTNGNASFTGRRLSFSCSKYAMDKAAQGGHLEVLQLLHDQGNGCTTSAMDWAAAFGQTEVVKWLFENRPEGCTQDAMDHAAANGHLKTVQWLHENGTEGCTRYALTDAAGNGHMETAIWLHRNRNEGCGRRAMDDAAANGHLEMVRWLNCNRTEGCSREAMERAARNGHIEVVKLLHDMGVPCTSAAIHLAEMHAHHDVSAFLNAMYPGKTLLFDFSTDAMVLAEQEMVEEDKKRDIELQREARRRRQSIMSSDGSRKRRQGPDHIQFGQDGKPSLSPINTRSR